MKIRASWPASLVVALGIAPGLAACAIGAPEATDATAPAAAGEGGRLGSGTAAVPAASADPEADPEADAEGETSSQGADLVIYSGRSENLVGPLVERFEEKTGLEVELRWGDTADLAATLLEEGERSPADLFYAQDPGGLGAVADHLAPLPESLLAGVDPRFRDAEGRWTGVSGRARVLAYNTEAVQAEDLPADMQALTDPVWRGRIGWAPGNASFQTMVTAMRAAWGEDETRAWLEGILANEPEAYDNNSAIVEALGAGEIDLGLVNHYYLYRFLKERGEDFPVRNQFLSDGGPGALVLVSGAGRLATAAHPENAERFIAFLLSPESQRYFADETFEYPLIEDPAVLPPLGVPARAELEAIDLAPAELTDLAGSVALLREVGALP